ncbi:MAG: ABC transporter ATP-binding protein [Lachnospiraceae bacterium]|nr:ABC transporter ATP-binding protein [Lachnospiraceae bacterium]
MGMKEAWKDRDNQYKYAKWLAKYSKPYMGRIALMMVFSILTTVISLWMVQISKDIIDNATGGRPFVTFLIVYFAMLIGLEVISVIGALISAVLNEKFSFGIRKQIYDKIIRSHWMDVKKYHTGDLMTRLTSDAGTIAEGIIGTIPSIIVLCVELLMVFVTLFMYSPLLAVFALLVAPVAALSSWWLGRKLKKLQIKV